MQSDHIWSVTKRDMSSRTNSKSIYISVYLYTKWHAMPSAIRARQCLRSQEVDIDPRSVAPCKCLPPDVFASKLIHRSNHKPALLTKTITKNSRGPRKSRSCAKVEAEFRKRLGRD